MSIYCCLKNKLSSYTLSLKNMILNQKRLINIYYLSSYLRLFLSYIILYHFIINHLNVSLMKF